MSVLREILLRPLSLLYGVVVSLRNFLYDRDIFRSRQFPFPVICVGNISAGGTGKTPHVSYLAGMLSPVSPVAILSRGYLRKSRGFREVKESDTVALSGDEPLQMVRGLAGVKVFVDRDRAHGLDQIKALYPEIKTVILDDGFQHRRVNAGMNIILTSWGRLMTRDHLLPYGRLRERLKRISRTDIVIVTKTPENMREDDRANIEKEIKAVTSAKLFFSTLAYGDLKPVFGDFKTVSMTRETGVVIVTGIADPDPLCDFVSARAGEVIHVAFSDHHSFTASDAERITAAFYRLTMKDKIILTTEKDSVRLKELSIIAVRFREKLFYIPVRVKFVDKEDVFKKILTEYAGKDHCNGRLS